MKFHSWKGGSFTVEREEASRRRGRKLYDGKGGSFPVEREEALR